MERQKQLIVVYNTKSLPFNQAFDFFHRHIIPETFPCNLSKLILHNLSENNEWKRFTETLPIDVRYFYKDMFQKKYPSVSVDFPAIFLTTGSSLICILSAELIGGIVTLEDLIKIILDRIQV
ncbi:MAG: hypothetical protein WC505_02780 [Patescibacteria group bacterium]